MHGSLKQASNGAIHRDKTEFSDLGIGHQRTESRSTALWLIGIFFFAVVPLSLGFAVAGSMRGIGDIAVATRGTD